MTPPVHHAGMTWNTERGHLDTLLADSAVPATVRATITDHLARVECGEQAVAGLRADLARTRQAEHDQLVTGRDTALAMFAAGKYDPDRVAPDLELLRARVAHLDTRYTITSRALQTCQHRAGRCIAEHAAELLPYVAEHRTGLPATFTVPAHVAYAWSVIARVVTFTLPLDAWLEERDGVLIAHRPGPIHVAPGDQRSYWAWCAYRAGLCTITDLGPGAGPVEVTITAPWSARADLIANVGTTAVPAPVRIGLGRRGRPHVV